MAYIGNTPAASYTSFAKQDFTTSATTSYTLDYPVANENEVALFINFVRQEPTTAYSASGTSLTLTSATSATDDMYCVYLGKAVQTVNPPNGSVGLSQLSATGTKDATTFLRGDNTFASAGGANTPAFYAYASSGTACSSGADTKIIFQTEIYDTDGKYDTSTGRFTPTVAGKYFVATQISLASAQDGANYQCILKKNGSVYAKSQDWMYGGDYSTNLSSVVDLDTDDYIETFVYHNSAGGTKNTSTADKYNFFSAFRIIT